LQNTDEIQTRKQKALRPSRAVVEEADDDDVEMEEVDVE